LTRILVIKHSALGDMALAFGPMKAIRRHHPDAHITLLTTPGLRILGERCGLVDEVWTDTRPKLWRLRTALKLRRRLRQAGYERVYDLQTSNRTAWYFRLLGPGPRPEWSGTAPGCSHPHREPRRGHMHLVEAQAGQLADAGVPETPLSDLSWWQADIRRLGLPEEYAVLLPGGAPHRPGKRWPAKRFAAVARRLAEFGITPVTIGGPPEAEEAATIVSACPDTHDLTGQTALMDLAPVMRGARVVVGNDTGPMHVAALVGRPCVVLFGADSDPELSRPRAHSGNPAPIVLRAADLADLPVDTVWKAASDILREPNPLPR